MKAKDISFEILRWMAAAAAILSLVIMFRSEPVSSNAKPETVEAAVANVLDMDKMIKADNRMIKRLYGIDTSAYEYVSLYYPTTNMEAEELLIIKLKDTAQGDEVKAAVEKRIETQKTSFDGYGIEQYDMLTNNAVVDVQGNYVLFVVNKDSDKAHKAFLNSL